MRKSGSHHKAVVYGALTQQCLFGRKSEKSKGQRGKLPGQLAEAGRACGHQRRQPGDGRTTPTTLPAVLAALDLPAVDKCCPQCGLGLAPYAGSEDSEVIDIDIDIEVREYRRLIRQSTTYSAAPPPSARGAR